MKNALICILTIALSGAAFLSRPTEEDFHDLLRRHEQREEPAQERLASARKKAARPGRPPRREPEREREREPEQREGAGQVHFLDRLLWVEIRQDGKTVYAGCFSHWWDGKGRMFRA